MITGERIRKRRRDLNISQEALGTLVDVHANTIRKWEQGIRSPDIRDMNKLAEALNTTVAYLSGETEIIEKPTMSHSEAEDAQKLQQMLKHSVEDNFRSSVLGWADGLLIYNDGEQVIRLKDTPENKKIFHNIVYEMLDNIARNAEAQEQPNIPPVNITQQNIGRDAKAEVRQIAEATA